jgi:phosphoribosylformimino-5-aminoimidazole carboxamide ribonucleotide (ProFAR) isomerase
MTNPFTVLPAIDIADGRLATPRGAQRSSVLGSSIEDVLHAVADAGGTWVHLVDLDRARETGSNDASIREAIAFAHAAGLKVQLSGGLHNASALSHAMQQQPDRINIACEALLDRDLLTQLLSDATVELNVCLDAQNGVLIARGTNTPCGNLDEALEWLRPHCSRVVVTNIDADSTLTGPDIALVKHVADQGFRVWASGGVRNAEDLAALRSLAADGVVGAIVGAALHLGHLTLAECF